MKRKLCLLLFFCLLLIAPALRAQQKATPRSGEGISTFLLRHNRAPKKYYNDFIELNKAKLGKSRTLKMGVTYLIPPVKKASAATSGKTTEAAAEKTSAHQVAGKAKGDVVGIFVFVEFVFANASDGARIGTAMSADNIEAGTGKAIGSDLDI